MARHTLLIDADDTLWENNIFFEKTIAHFISQLEYLGYTPEYIRHILNETERRNIRQHGYGVRSFHRSLEETYLKLAGNMAQARNRARRSSESSPNSKAHRRTFSKEFRKRSRTLRSITGSFCFQKVNRRSRSRKLSAPACFPISMPSKS